MSVYPNKNKNSKRKINNKLILTKFVCYPLNMKIDNLIYNYFEKEAKKSIVDTINIGLGYTAVVLKDGRCGLCCTLTRSITSCTIWKNPENFENQSALKLLNLIHSNNCLDRSITIALVNALNHNKTAVLPIDTSSMFKDLALKENSTVAMIGYFMPIVKELKKNNIKVITFDIGKNIGNKEDFYEKANKKADAIILTATSLINCTFEEVLADLSFSKAPIALIGPSTIMEPSLYDGTKISILAGTHTLDNEKILKAVRNAKGTHTLHKFSKKVYLKID